MTKATSFGLSALILSALATELIQRETTLKLGNPPPHWEQDPASPFQTPRALPGLLLDLYTAVVQFPEQLTHNISPQQQLTEQNWLQWSYRQVENNNIYGVGYKNMVNWGWAGEGTGCVLPTSRAQHYRDGTTTGLGFAGAEAANPPGQLSIWDTQTDIEQGDASPMETTEITNVDSEQKYQEDTAPTGVQAGTLAAKLAHIHLQNQK